MRPRIAREIENRDLKILEALARAGAFAPQAVADVPLQAKSDAEYDGKILNLGAYSVPACWRLCDVVRWRL